MSHYSALRFVIDNPQSWPVKMEDGTVRLGDVLILMEKYRKHCEATARAQAREEPEGRDEGAVPPSSADGPPEGSDGVITGTPKYTEATDPPRT